MATPSRWEGINLTQTFSPQTGKAFFGTSINLQASGLESLVIIEIAWVLERGNLGFKSCLHHLLAAWYVESKP